MWYLYLDESGDLGFDFKDKCPTRFFTICILAFNQRESFKKTGKAVKKTLERKLGKPKKSRIYELKGSRTSIDVKKFFWKQISNYPFDLYAVTVDKLNWALDPGFTAHRVYNFVARQVVDSIPFETHADRIQLVVDKSKAKWELLEFNRCIISHLEGRIPPKTPINIDHSSSREDLVLQAVDLFAWGVFRKYERDDAQWYDCFSEKIISDILYKK